MRHVLAALAMALLLPLEGGSCPEPESPLSEWIGTFDRIARVRVRAVQEVPQTSVGEIEVLEELRGSLGASTVYLPLDFAQRPDGGPVQPGDTAFLLVPPQADYRGTRGFWAEVDALRKDAPLVESGVVMWIPVVDEKVALTADIVLALGGEHERVSVDGEPRLHLVPVRSFVLALQEALAQESGPAPPEH